MGDKVAARVAAEAAGVPVVPGSDGRIDDPAKRGEVAAGHRLSGDDQGGGRRRRPRHPHRPRHGRIRNPDAAGQRRGQGRLRRWRALYREGHRARPPYRSADSGRRQARHPLFRAGMLAAAPPPESLGGSAIRGAAAGGAREALRFGRGAGRGGELSRRRHARISLRRPDASFLFHRDEHPHPGRASGDRNDHRHRSGARDDPHLRRRAAAHHAEGQCA